jgi:hypothetical protein
MLYVSKLMTFLDEGDKVEVFLDEMPVYQSAGRLKARALKGQRAVEKVPPGDTFTAKATVEMAISPTLGPVAYSVLAPVKSGRVWRGAYGQAAFKEFIGEICVALLSKKDEVKGIHVLIMMDGTSEHGGAGTKARQLKQLAPDAGAAGDAGAADKDEDEDDDDEDEDEDDAGTAGKARRTMTWRPLRMPRPSSRPTRRRSWTHSPASRRWRPRQGRSTGARGTSAAS